MEPLSDALASTFSDLRKRAFLLGLTGGIGSGKTTAANIMRGFGAVILDADSASHALTAPAGSALPALRAHFGHSIFDAEGALDRAQLRQRILTDSTAKRELENILHPRIEAWLLEQAYAALAQRPGASPPILVWDLPLLADTAKWPARLHRVLCIDCEESTQMARILARNAQRPLARQLSAEQAKALIDQQVSRSLRCAMAHDIIYNQAITLEAFASDLWPYYQRYQTLSTSIAT